MTWVWRDLAGLGQGPTLLMLALADGASADGACRPLMGTLARRARMTPDGVQGMLNALVGMGLVRPVETDGPTAPGEFSCQLVLEARFPHPFDPRPSDPTGEERP